ncbi:MAG: 1-acyl-sn-glycerol-3-phosphate acyltransferase [Candidatus Omnitrophica bacterium]|nr:1-acyl-sn-glycerol-3-phosphate acyltransferase [Candidatus Omnitrophota bacterium]
MEVKNKREIPLNSAFILASNHYSNLDPIVLGVSVPCKLYFLAKEELFKNKIFAIFLRFFGAVPLKRKRIDVLAVKKAISLLKDNKPVVIFPQGRRSKDLNDIQPGVGYLFKKTSVPIVVALILGTDKVLPRGGKFLKLNKIKVIFKRLENIGNNLTAEEISEFVWDKIKDMAVYH